MIGRLPETPFSRLAQFLETLVDPVAAAFLTPKPSAAATAPPGDEPLTEEDHRRFREGQAAAARGEPGVPMEDVLAAFGLTMADFPLKR